MVRTADSRFFRDMVTSMRNGVLAIRRDGRLVMVNEEAYRILDITPQQGDAGRHFSDFLRNHHDLVRMLAGGFDMCTLPNRAEMRLKPSGKVIGYTLSLVHDDHHRVHGAALFFKDLTLVEQAEERERLRDRLAALGEMAATIFRTMARPRPEPCGLVVKNGLKMRSVMSDGIPGPSSETVNSTASGRSSCSEGSSLARRRTTPRPPSASRALMSRFVTTWHS